MKARTWRFRHLVGLLINGGGLAILIGEAMKQVLR
jgi:hypothetical protein